MRNLIAVLFVLIPNSSFATTFYCQDQKGKPVTITVDEPSEISSFPLVNCHELTKTCSMDFAHSAYVSAAFATDPMLRQLVTDALAKKGWIADSPDSQVNGVLNFTETQKVSQDWAGNSPFCDGGNDSAHCQHATTCTREVALSIVPNSSRASPPEINLDNDEREFAPDQENWDNACGFYHKVGWFVDPSTSAVSDSLWRPQRWEWVIANVPDCASYYGQ